METTKPVVTTAQASELLAQTHEKFRLFSAPITAGLPNLLAAVSTTVTAEQLAAKSISIQEVAGDGTIYATLGYRDDEAGYPVRFVTETLGTVGQINVTQLQQAIDNAAKDVNHIICQDFFATPEGTYAMVFMVQTQVATNQA